MRLYLTKVHRDCALCITTFSFPLHFDAKRRKSPHGADKRSPDAYKDEAIPVSTGEEDLFSGAMKSRSHWYPAEQEAGLAGIHAFLHLHQGYVIL